MLLLWALLLSLEPFDCSGLMFRAEQFKELSPECKSSVGGKPITYILNEENPALYVSVDPYVRIKSAASATRRRLDSMSKLFNLGDARLMHDLHYGDPTFSLHHRLGGVSLAAASSANSNKNGNNNNAGHHGHRPPIPSNATFDCVIQVQTELPRGEKSDGQYDALSLMVVQLYYGDYPRLPQHVQVSTFGHLSPHTRLLTKPAAYADRMWATANPNFLLSGQLSGFDSIDYRTKVEPQHIIKPETLHSTFDKPASIKVNLTRWNANSHVYLVFTSYKYLRHGERCREHKEFDCAPPAFLSSSSDHLCMSQNLACDGLPNCGQDFLPNQDENCFKIHWSSILLSLVSYILLAITLLLCLSCFARLIIQWSVRSSIAEIRGAAGAGAAAGAGGGQFATSPTGSFRSSSRFFSFLGNTFASRWERPPPTYDEALKHVNPDLTRPDAPPAYSDADYALHIVTMPIDERAESGGGVGGAHRRRALSADRIRMVGRSGNVTTASIQMTTGIVSSTPPPEYEQHQQQRHQQQQTTQTCDPPLAFNPHRRQHQVSMSPPPNLTFNSSSSSCEQQQQQQEQQQPALVVVPPTPVDGGVVATAAATTSSAATDGATTNSSNSPGKSCKDASTRVVEAEICQTHL